MTTSTQEHLNVASKWEHFILATILSASAITGVIAIPTVGLPGNFIVKSFMVFSVVFSAFMAFYHWRKFREKK